MRTFDEIKQAIQQDFVNSLTMRDLYGIAPADTFTNVFSPVSLEAANIHITAAAIYLYEKIIDG
ncbi:MAG: hypothetical protein LBL04_11405, partial [Bacteroidales bacterium]|nr:hypothetical protein [Bacteroidales bacterium]